MLVARRSFITGVLSGLIAAPMIAKAENLMKIVSVPKVEFSLMPLEEFVIWTINVNGMGPKKLRYYLDNITHIYIP